MQDLMPPINTPDSAFHDGDPTTGQLGTIVTALWLNNVQSATRDVQLEIKNVLAKAGIQPDPKKTNQLAEAISQIIGSGNYASIAYVDNGLNKKIDKASISGVLGNANDKVPSLNLLATELGKKQPAGNYQPKGDYATNVALNNGLEKKLNLTGGQLTGSLTSTGVIESHLGRVSAVIPSGNGVGLDATGNLPALRSRKAGGSYLEHVMPDSAGKLAQIGDGGIGVSTEQARGNSGINSFISYTSAAAATEHGWPTNGAGFQCVYAETRRAQFHISQQGEVSSRFSQLSGSDKETPWNKHYTTANTKLDKNGYLKSASNSIELVGVPVGGSILWNANAPIPSDFWANEGRSFSKTEYPEAAKIFPDLKLPDDRGYAIRIADNGRGIDAGRTVGTYQEDAMRNLTGTIGGHWRTSLSAFSGVFTGGRVAQANTKGETDETYLGAEFDASKQVPTAHEFRMKNVAKILITRMR